MDQFAQVTFRRFKAFDNFVVTLRHFNILVGPNNAGKSTILAAFRILAAAMRRANNRRAEPFRGPRGRTVGYPIDLRAISIAEENIFFNYDASEPASVTFKLSNKNQLTLYFPEQGSCYLIADAHGQEGEMPAAFRSQFNCPISFVPILGPVEHSEPLLQAEAARLALFNYRAARNFRNIWYHFPQKFEKFRAALRQTWPGMDINPPEIDRTSYGKPTLHMFCPEERIPREIFWAGFGFQVWCQMLTHLIQSSDAALFLIDEPDIYLHSELQRQLVSLLRNLGPDVLIATHSTEIITEAEPDDIVLVNKRRRLARRIHNPTQLEEVFSILGSNLNPILTQLAKTRRVLFLEGLDFQIVAKFAARLGAANVANRSHFAVVPVGGFNPERIRSLKTGMETTLGGKILAAAVLDRDYRTTEQCRVIAADCAEFCQYVRVLKRKEIENFLLVPQAIDRAASRRIIDQAKRTGVDAAYSPEAAKLLQDFADDKRSYVAAQYLAFARSFERGNSPGVHEATINESILKEFEDNWQDFASRMEMVPGKEALAFVNQRLQARYHISLTPTAVIDAMKPDEVPAEMRELIDDLSKFADAPLR